MSSSGATTTLARVQSCLERLKAGDPSARHELISVSCERLGGMAHRILQDYARVSRWVESGDVLNEAVLRLDRALKEVRPENAHAFLQFAAVQMNRVLIDLYRSLYGPEGMAAHHHSHHASKSSDSNRSLADASDLASGPESQVERGEMQAIVHEVVDSLPETERQVVNLCFYNGLTQEEAGQILGVSARQVKRYWRSAKHLLYEKLSTRNLVP